MMVPFSLKYRCSWQVSGEKSGRACFWILQSKNTWKNISAISVDSKYFPIALYNSVPVFDTALPFGWREHQFSSVQLLSRVRLFATPWIAARQASLSITNSQSSLRLMSIESVMASSHLILCRPLFLMPQSLPASESFPMSQLFTWGGQSTGVLALASFLPKNTQDWSPLERTGWISLQSKGRSRVFSNITVQKHQFFSAQLSSQSNSHIQTWLLEKL